FVDKELQIGDPITDRDRPEQQYDQLRRANSFGQGRRQQRAEQKTVAQRDIAIDNPVPRRKRLYVVDQLLVATVYDMGPDLSERPGIVPSQSVNAQIHPGFLGLRYVPAWTNL